MIFQYQSDKGYYYQVGGGGGGRRQRRTRRTRRTRRIRKEDFQAKNQKMPQIKDRVEIIVKPYHKNHRVRGIVKRVLTKKRVHTRGHKVELENGTIGRIIKKIN